MAVLGALPLPSAARGTSVAGVILAGGRARRLGGASKPLLDVGGARIIDRVHAALAPLCQELLVVGDPAELGDVGLPVVPDRRPGLGPLAGLEAALCATRSDRVLLVGGDMPLVTTALLRRLLAEAPSHPAVCFGGASGPEPLCARYARSVLPLVTAHLDAGRLALHELLAALGALHLPLVSDEDRGALANVNTAADLAEARRRVAAPAPERT